MLPNELQCRIVYSILTSARPKFGRGPAMSCLVWLLIWTWQSLARVQIKEEGKIICWSVGDSHCQSEFLITFFDS